MGFTFIWYYGGGEICGAYQTIGLGEEIRRYFGSDFEISTYKAVLGETKPFCRCATDIIASQDQVSVQLAGNVDGDFSMGSQSSNYSEATNDSEATEEALHSEDTKAEYQLISAMLLKVAQLGLLAIGREESFFFHIE